MHRANLTLAAAEYVVARYGFKNLPVDDTPISASVKEQNVHMWKSGTNHFTLSCWFRLTPDTQLHLNKDTYVWEFPQKEFRKVAGDG